VQNGPVDTDERPVWTLPAAAALGAIEATLLVAAILFVSHRLPVFALVMAAKIPFCVLLLRRRPGAFFAVLLWEFGGLAAALFAPHVAIGLRVLELGLATTVLSLLWASAAQFPSPELPSP
jgi:hypothetical protein